MKQPDASVAHRVPPGQALTEKWPVLTYGRTPRFDPRRWTSAASDLGADPQAPNTVSAAILGRISRLLGDLPRHAQVRAVHLVLEPWTVQAGLLTPTLKIKRQAVEARYGSRVQSRAG